MAVRAIPRSAVTAATPRSAVTPAIPRDGPIIAGDMLLEDGSGYWMFEDGTVIAWGGVSQAGLEDGSGVWLFENLATVVWG